MISFEVWRGIDLFVELNFCLNLLLMYLKRRGDRRYYNLKNHEDISYEAIKYGKIGAGILFWGVSFW